jgi:hypothetical protein
MKKLFGNRRALIVMGLFLVAALFLCCPAYAQIVICTHGQSGHLQDSSVTSVPVYWGWGLDFVLNCGTILCEWVHFAVPTVWGEHTRYVGFEFATGSIDAVVSQVDVWNGNTRVASFAGLNWNTTGPNDVQLKVLDLGSDISFESIGISIGLSKGVESMSHRFLFHEACAEFH